MNENVIPIRKVKSERFCVYLGHLDENGQVVERDQVGLAYMRPNSKSWRLKLWTWTQTQYFIVPDQKDQTQYTIYSLEEYLTESKELKTYWNKIGEAEYYGTHLRLNFQLLSQELYLSLFPETKKEIYLTKGGDAA